jgi:hypothetical protein
MRGLRPANTNAIHTLQAELLKTLRADGTERDLSPQGWMSRLSSAVLEGYMKITITMRDEGDLGRGDVCSVSNNCRTCEISNNCRKCEISNNCRTCSVSDNCRTTCNNSNNCRNPPQPSSKSQPLNGFTDLPLRPPLSYSPLARPSDVPASD